MASAPHRDQGALALRANLYRALTDALANAGVSVIARAGGAGAADRR